MCGAALRHSMPFVNLQRFEKCLYARSRVDCNCFPMWLGVGLCEYRRGRGGGATHHFFQHPIGSFREKGKVRCLSKKMMREKLSKGSQGTFFYGQRNACACFGHRRPRSKRGLWLPVTPHLQATTTATASRKVKMQKVWISKTTTLHVHHAFLYFSLPSLHDYNVKVPNFTFCRGRERNQRLYFYSLELWYCLPESNSRNLPTFDELNELE